MSTEFCAIHCTCPSSETARRIASMLVQQNQAACVNILPGITSIYSWEGELRSDREVLMIIKTLKNGFDAVATTIRQHHPAELPEIIAVPINNGSPDYLDWIKTSISQ